MSARCPVPLIFSRRYNFSFGPHVFPVLKYEGIVNRIVAEGICRPEDLIEPAPAADEDLLLVHTREYLRKLKENTLSPQERITLEIPYSLELLEVMRIAVGGTMLAATKALHSGLAVHVGGGFHHAFPGHGEGFCLLNDVAVATRRLLRSRAAARAMIVDCDLHQGNGTASIFRGSQEVFTFSIHQEYNYPFQKPPSSLDIGLEDGAGDSEYLAALRVVEPLMEEIRPDFVFYLAGADPYEQDQLGSLALTKRGLLERDRLVLESAQSRKIPLAVVLAGGYAARLSDTVDIHINTIGEAIRIAGNALP